MEKARAVMEEELLSQKDARLALAKAYEIINHACREPHDDMRSIIRGIIDKRE